MSRHHKRRGRFTRPKAPRKLYSFDIETHVSGAKLLPPGEYGVSLASVDYAEVENRVVMHMRFDISNPHIPFDTPWRQPEGVRSGRFPANVPNESTRPKP